MRNFAKTEGKIVAEFCRVALPAKIFREKVKWLKIEKWKCPEIVDISVKGVSSMSCPNAQIQINRIFNLSSFGRFIDCLVF